MKYTARRLSISITLLGGYVVMVVNEVNIGYMIVGLLVIVFLAFLWMPEIQGISTKYFSLSKKIDEVMVQYEEFKETVYPLLELELANLASIGYMDAGPKSDKIVDFIERLKKLKIVDDKMDGLVAAAKSQALRAFRDELKNFDARSEKMISTGLTSYSSDDYVIGDDIYVDFDGLKNLANDIEDIKTKIKYKKKLQELEEFYKNNF